MIVCGRGWVPSGWLHVIYILTANFPVNAAKPPLPPLPFTHSLPPPTQRDDKDSLAPACFSALTTTGPAAAAGIWQQQKAAYATQVHCMNKTL
jgi:hypothetical protein